VIDQTHKLMKKKDDKQTENDLRNIQLMMICMSTAIYSQNNRMFESNESSHEHFMMSS
jgi:hypothetical protein